MMPINEIVCGSAKEVMAQWPDESINCCISSPPYWALRDYGIKGQLGLEPTFEEYIDKLCTIYDEVFRVLRKDGTCWVNLGDTYNNVSPGGRNANRWPKQSRNDHLPAEKQLSKKVQVKSLCLIPQRFAIEMVNRGWILRNVIIWHKPNPMPSSAKDRFTVDFEYVFFFVKSNETLFWVRPDGVMVSNAPDYKSGEQDLDWTWGVRKGKRVKLSLWKGYCYWFEPQYEPFLTESNTERPRMGQGNQTKYHSKRGYGGGGSSFLGHSGTLKADGTQIQTNPLGRNKRTVWTIPTQSFPDAHFATFPEKLVEPMIKAGCPEFVCKKCGKGREKIYDTSYELAGGKGQEKYGDNTPDDGSNPGPQGMKYGRANAQHYFKGYTDCGCNAGWRPGIVLDCFRGKRNHRQRSGKIAA